VEVCAVQLPAREDRLREPALGGVEQVIEHLAEAVAPRLDRPLALFGHSMGGMLAFELVRALRERGAEPVALFVSGSRAPHLPRQAPVLRHLPDAELMAAVAAINGIPAAVRDAGLMELTLPALRGDFSVVETYVYRPQPPLRCPVVAFAGADDHVVSGEEVAEWSKHAAGTFRLHVLPGGHFFVQTCRSRLLATLRWHLNAIGIGIA
jgi:medium-chain acyl-[acyl-carrier-protein] hydrolase